MLWTPEPDEHGGVRAPLGHEDFSAGSTSLRYVAYAGTDELPEQLVASVRCLVLVGRMAVVVENEAGNAGVLPGGHIEDNETWEQTASRELAEESGVQVAAESLSRLGHLHVRRFGPDAAPSDSLQPVYLGRADSAPTEWVDLSHGRLRQVWLVDGSNAGPLPVRPCHRALIKLALGE